MTATGRSKRISPQHDVYPTPQWAVDRFLEEWPLASDGKEMHWLEPGAGDGAIARAVDTFRASRGLIPIEWTLCEIRDFDVLPHLEAITSDVRICDFITSPIGVLMRPDGRPYDCGIFNPPFALTMEFLRRANELCLQIAMLQRQNFIGSAERNKELRANMPDQYMIPDRVDFVGDGAGDAIGHSWWTWGPYGPYTRGELVLLECTPLEVRKAHRPRVSLKRPIPTQKIRTRTRRKKAT